MNGPTLEATSIFFIIMFVSTKSNLDSVDVEDLNWIVDLILESTIDYLEASTMDSIPIPNMEDKFHKKILFVKLSGGAKATGGVFKNLTTLKRTGDSKLTVDGNTGKITVVLGLADMEVCFSHCRAWLGKLSISDSLYFKVNQNSLEGQLSIFDDGKSCSSTLDYTKFNLFKDWKIKMKGLGPLDALLDLVGTSVLKHFNTNIRSMLEQELYEHVAKAMKEYNICDLLAKSK